MSDRKKGTTDRQLREMQAFIRQLEIGEAEPIEEAENVLHAGDEIASAILEELVEFFGGMAEIVLRQNLSPFMQVIYFLFLYAEMHPGEAKDIANSILSTIGCTVCSGDAEEVAAMRRDIFDRKAKMTLRRFRETYRIEYVAGEHSEVTEEA